MGAKDLTYAFVRDPSGRLVPARKEENEGPSAEVLLEQFRAEKERTRETLERAGSTARTISRGLRRGASQQKIRAAISCPPPPPDKPPAE